MCMCSGVFTIAWVVYLLQDKVESQIVSIRLLDQIHWRILAIYKPYYTKAFQDKMSPILIQYSTSLLHTLAAIDITSYENYKHTTLKFYKLSCSCI